MQLTEMEHSRQAPLSEVGDLWDHPLWTNCRESTIERLLQESVRRNFSPGAIIALEKTPANFLHVVIKGTVELFARYRKQETEFALIEAPHSFIVAAVILNRFNLTSARALQASDILMIPAGLVREAFDLDEIFARRMANELAHSYRTVTREVKSQTLLTGIERLANWLLERDAESGGRHGFVIPFEKKALAARLGMVPEVLSRAFACLGKYDVRVRGATVEIRDRPALYRLARPKPHFYDPKE
jgi:CRP/FNR family transcriptional activator FtrB